MYEWGDVMMALPYAWIEERTKVQSRSPDKVPPVTFMNVWLQKAEVAEPEESCVPRLRHQLHLAGRQVQVC